MIHEKHLKALERERRRGAELNRAKRDLVKCIVEQLREMLATIGLAAGMYLCAKHEEYWYLLGFFLVGTWKAYHYFFKFNKEFSAEAKRSAE